MSFKKIIITLVKINNKLFFLSLRLKNYLRSKKKLKILITDKKEWTHMVINGFKHTHHEVCFEQVSAEKVTNFDLVIPLTIDEMIQLNADRAKIENNFIPIPSKESILTCDDKMLFNAALIKNGFEKYIPKLGSNEYPYVLKKKVDAWGQHCHIISTPEQASQLQDLHTDTDYFQQKLIPGKYEYATHIFFKNNKIVSSINIQYAFETAAPIKGKDNFIFTRVCSCPHLKLFADILKVIGFQGICCFNYKEHEKQPFILEINPRVGASLCLYLFSFVDYIEYLEFL